MTAEEVAKEKDGEKMLKRDAALMALEESSDEEEGDEDEDEEEEEEEEENMNQQGSAAAVGDGVGAMAGVGDDEVASVDVTVEGRKLAVVRRRDGSYLARTAEDPGAELEVVSLHGGSLYVGLGDFTRAST